MWTILFIFAYIVGGFASLIAAILRFDLDIKNLGEGHSPLLAVAAFAWPLFLGYVFLELFFKVMLHGADRTAKNIKQSLEERKVAKDSSAAKEPVKKELKKDTKKGF